MDHPSTLLTAQGITETIYRPQTVINLRESRDGCNMTPTIPSRECNIPPTPPGLPHNEVGTPPRKDEEITSHDKSSSDDAQQDLLPMSLSKYRKEQHDIAKRCNKVLDKAIQKAKTRSSWHREVSKLCNQRAERWKEALEVATHDYDEANEDALQIRSEADNIISFISLAEKMPASIKPAPENMASYRETLANFEARHKGALLFAEEYKHSKEQISRVLEKLSRRIKYEEEKVQEDIEQLVQIDGKDAIKLFEAHPRFFKDLEAMNVHFRQGALCSSMVKLSLALWIFYCFLEVDCWPTTRPGRGSPPLKIDLIFPRNETYNPSPMFPIIFSYGNPEMIPLFEPIISYTVWNPSNYNKSIHAELRDKPFVNFSSSNPHIEFDYYSYPFNTEGTWELSVHLRWANCYMQSPRERDLDERVRMRRNFTTLGTVVFTTKGPLKQVDLADATNNETCSNPIGLSIDTGEWKFPIFDDAHDVDFVGSSCIVPQSLVEADSAAGQEMSLMEWIPKKA
ncbi:uncharacterized protein FIESC28_01417 [Fusarium coffeatum]|uniref:DUF7136 domain-containing protein n=1 Tax=Fusarium coffeatum TaxID=231269 RepID=A0A366S8X2_9HYPO|nr:uncharacterized protein FIESC28_01417 [Fusarium coffeatum]RBR25787.1 hypothetical protein FIESC28_01417 [Fusarium coffeatum]